MEDIRLGQMLPQQDASMENINKASTIDVDAEA